MQPNRPKPRGARLSDYREQLRSRLRIPFISGEDLKAAGEFDISGYDTRINRKFSNRPECVYTVVIRETGEIRQLTLGVTAFRKAVGDIVNGLPRGESLGPLVLVQGEARENEDAPWIFGELDESGQPIAVDLGDEPGDAVEPPEPPAPVSKPRRV